MVYYTIMSGITNLLITFYNGTPEGAQAIRERLKQHAGDFDLKILCNRGSQRSHLDSIMEFYEGAELISVDEWDFEDLNMVMEPMVTDEVYLDGERIIEMTMANQVEVTVACRMSYLYGAEVYCGQMKGIDKRINAPRMVDVSKLGRMKRAVLKAVGDGIDHTIPDIHRIIEEGKLEYYNSPSQKHVRTHVKELVDSGLLEENGRITVEFTGRKNTLYRITEKGKVSMTLYRQGNR